MEEFKIDIPDVPEQQELAPEAESYAPPVPEFKYAPRQREIDFAQLVAAGGDPIQALIKSGILSRDDLETMKRAAIYRMATRLLESEAVQERLDYFRKLHFYSMNITSERILQEWAAISFADIAQTYEPEGRPIRNPHMLPRHVRAAIKEMYTDKDGVTRIKFYDKMKPLEHLADFNGMLNDAHAAKAAQVTINLDSGGQSLPPQKTESNDAGLAPPPSAQGNHGTSPQTDSSMPPESNLDDLPDCLK